MRPRLLALLLLSSATGAVLLLSLGGADRPEPRPGVPGRSDFELVDEGVHRVQGAILAAGVADGVEMGAEPLLAHTPVTAGDCAYLVLARETFPGSVTGTRFVAELFADGESVGRLRFAQEAPDTGVAQVRLMWGLGPAPDPDAAYRVVLALEA